MKTTIAAAFAALFLLGTSSNAATLRLDSFTSPVQSVSVGASPVPGTVANVGASGFNLTDTSGGLGSFVGWCLDIGHRLMNVGASQDYAATNNPFSNSYGLSAMARQRIQSVFDANYGSVNLADGDAAAAFQMALWEAAYEGSSNLMSVSLGLFQASSTGSTALANQYLANAAAYLGGKKYQLTFLEVAGLGANRPWASGQNLVTAAPVPLPAAGLMLLTALAGAGVAARRRRAA